MSTDRFLRLLAVATLLVVDLYSQAAKGSGPSGHAETPKPLAAETRNILNGITAANLKGDLSFLASDTLEGRFTPSTGLDVAAEFIASQFRTAGLKPAGDHEYFQTAAMVDRRMNRMSSPLTIKQGGKTDEMPVQFLAALSASKGQKIEDAPAVVFAARNPEILKGGDGKSMDLKGKAVVVPQSFGKLPREKRAAAYYAAREFDKQITEAGAVLEILVGQARQPEAGAKLITAEEAGAPVLPAILAASDELQSWIDHPATQNEPRTISVEIPEPDDHKVTLKNVIGVLEGSDPALKNTYVLLTAHYDHIGTLETGARMSSGKSQPNGDRIFNGANDDGSGTVSVIEIARALGKVNPHPKRTLVFMTFFGEERGDIGSHYYGTHPVFPIAKTVADVNLEQVGRTDSTAGKHVNEISFTGYDYSDVTKYFEEAGRQTGIHVSIDKEASDSYFVRSDNAALAEKGVPAHSLTVAFEYPDYHGLGDDWTKIDYENMTRVDRAIALGLWRIAESATAPQWNSANEKTAPFREAQAKLRNR